MNPASPASWIEVSAAEVMSTTPLVSVLIATYNHEPYLAEAIESVLCQNTRFPFEVIIGEDFSKDATRRIALEYQRRHPDKIRVLFSDRNVGARANARRMRQAWRGRYVAWCEGDDYWLQSNKLQTQVDYLESHPKVGLVHGGFQTRIGNRINPAAPVLTPMPEGNVFEALLHRNFIATCTVCLRTEIARAYEKSFFWEQTYLMGDYPLWLFVSQHGDVTYLDEPLSVYRKVGGSMTHGSFTSQLQMALSNRQVKLNAMALYPTSAEGRRRALRESNLRVMKCAANAGDWRLCLSEYVWGLRHNIQEVIHPRYGLLWFAACLGIRRFKRHEASF